MGVSKLKYVYIAAHQLHFNVETLTSNNGFSFQTSGLGENMRHNLNLHSL